MIFREDFSKSELLQSHKIKDQMQFTEARIPVIKEMQEIVLLVTL